MNKRLLLLTSVGLGAAVHGLATRKARQLQAGADPFPYELLREEPPGDDQIVERPDGTRIHVRTSGSGPTVVLAHGYGCTLLEWNLIWAQLLALGCRCVAFDLRGHGRSTVGDDGIGSAQMAGDYEAVLTQLDIQDAVLVGHSTGGFLAIKAMLDHPELAERLSGFVAFASTAGELLRGSPQNRLQLPLIRLGVMEWISRSPTYSWMFGASLCGDAPSPAMIRAFNEVFAVQHHRGLVPLIRALANESYYARLSEIIVPTVVVCGDRDQSTPRWHSEQLGVLIPNARNVWVEGKGHLLNWEAPESLVAAVSSLQSPNG
jgi:pimeloyl-ACP methyl ester carboxylesterase